MCKLLCSVLLLLPFVLQAQVLDVEGTWEGVLTQPDDSRSLASTYPFIFSFIQRGTKVSGFSRIEITGTRNFAIMELSAVAGEKGIQFTELKINAQAIKGGFWCIKKGKLKYDNALGGLLGTWDAPNCGRGEIKVFRVSDGTKGGGLGEGRGPLSGKR